MWGAGPRRLRAGFVVIYNIFELENERGQGQGQRIGVGLNSKMLTFLK